VNEVASSRNTGVSAHGTDTIRFITLLLVPYAQDTFLQPFRRPSPSTLNPSANSAPDLHRKPRHAWGGCAPARRRRARPTSHSTHGRVRPTAETAYLSQAYLRESPRGPSAPLHRVCAPSHLIHRGRRSTARRRAWCDTTCAHTHTRTRSRRTGERARLHVWRGQAGSTGGGACIRPALPQGCYDHPAAPATNAALSLPMRVSVDRARPVQGRDSCFSATDSLYQVFTGRTRSQPLSRWWGGWRRRRRGRVSGRTPGGHHRRPGQEPVLWKGEVVR